MNNIDNTNRINNINEKTPHVSFCFLLWILKIEIIIISIFCACAFIINKIPDTTKFVIKYNIQKTFYKKIQNKNDYTFYDVECSINDNKNISQEEKDFLISNLNLEITENLEYIDIKSVIEKIENFEISYNKRYYYNEEKQIYESKIPRIYNSNIVGRYNSFFNTIYLYEQIGNKPLENYNNQIFSFKECNKQAYFHEINHLLEKNCISNNGLKNNNMILEIINEMFTRKYFKGDMLDEKASNLELVGEAYDNIIPYGYKIAEILPEEVLKEYKFNPKECILISGLLEINNNIEEAYNLIDGINSLDVYGNIELEKYRKMIKAFEYFSEL